MVGITRARALNPQRPCSGLNLRNVPSAAAGEAGPSPAFLSAGPSLVSLSPEIRSVSGGRSTTQTPSQSTQTPFPEPTLCTDVFSPTTAYTLMRFIAQGSFGACWVVRNTATRVPYCVKVRARYHANILIRHIWIAGEWTSKRFVRTHC